jgi:DNA-binding XRE family transcriptional regulator
MKLNEKLKLLRKIKRYTQIELAKTLNVGYSSVQNYEGEHREPNGHFMKKLCQQFPEYALWLMTDDIDVRAVENKTLQEKSIN